MCLNGRICQKQKKNVELELLLGDEITVKVINNLGYTEICQTTQKNQGMANVVFKMANTIMQVP